MPSRTQMEHVTAWVGQIRDYHFKLHRTELGYRLQPIWGERGSDYSWWLLGHEDRAEVFRTLEIWDGFTETEREAVIGNMIAGRTPMFSIEESAS